MKVEHPEVDMRKLLFDESTFDFVITDQVIEHLEDPQKAVEESYRVLKKRGTAMYTICFINYIHPAPKRFLAFFT